MNFFYFSFLLNMVFALALPGLGSAIADFAERSGLKTANKHLLNVVKYEGAGNTVKQASSAAKATKSIQSVLKIHGARSDFRQVGILAQSNKVSNLVSDGASAATVARVQYV